MLRLVFILSLLLIILPAFSFNISAHEGHDHEVAQAPSDTATASADQERVEYELAYPGMLPDHPLHFLKVVRDKVVGFLVADSVKKTEFNILTSDKRAYAAALLAEKGKYQMSIDTLSKSTNYLHEALSSLNTAKEEEESVEPLRERMEKSVKKHLEIVSQRIEPHLPENMQEDINREIERLQSMEKTVSELELD